MQEGKSEKCGSEFTMSDFLQDHCFQLPEVKIDVEGVGPGCR